MHAQRGYAWPSYRRITDELKIHRATAIRAVNALCERGWITVERSTGRGTSNRYRPSFGFMEPEGSQGDAEDRRPGLRS